MSRAIKAADGVNEILVHTGQHFDPGMSEIFFEELGLAAPYVNLGIHGGGHGEMTGRMLAALERVIIEERPDLVLVPGDTTSTLAGALAAANKVASYITSPMSWTPRTTPSCRKLATAVAVGHSSKALM